MGVVAPRQGRIAAAAAAARLACYAPAGGTTTRCTIARCGDDDRQYGSAPTSGLKDALGRRLPCAGSQCFTALERWCHADKPIAVPHHAEAPRSARQAGARARGHAAATSAALGLISPRAHQLVQDSPKELGGPGSAQTQPGDAGSATELVQVQHIRQAKTLTLHHGRSRGKTKTNTRPTHAPRCSLPERPPTRHSSTYLATCVRTRVDSS